MNNTKQTSFVPQTSVLIAVEMTLSRRTASIAIINAVFTRITTAMTRAPDEEATLSRVNVSEDKRLFPELIDK